MKKATLFLLTLLLTFAGALGLSAQTMAYTELSTDGKTLTFYYDQSRSSRSGTTYDLNTGSTAPGWYEKRSSINQVIFDPTFYNARPTSCYEWFVMSNLTSITGIEYLNTYSVTNMQYMFLGCPLENIDVSHFDTRNVTTMYGMFQNCPNLKNIDVRNFDTSNVKYMEYMFFGCSSLTSLDLSSFTFNSSTEATKMFLNNTSLKHLILPSTANNLASDACYGVGTAANPCSLYFTDDVTLSGVTSGSGYIQWKSGYFKVSNGETKAYANLSADGKRLTFYYDDCREGRSGTTYNALGYMASGSTSVPLWYNERESVTKVVFDDSFKDVRPTSCTMWFEGMKNLESIEKIQNLNTSEATSMYYMFSSCYKLTSLDLSGFNTAKVVSMDNMFRYCLSLDSLDLSGFNTAKVTSMADMFAYSNKLKTINLSSFDTSNVTDMSGMFSNCSRLTSLDVSHFDTSKVTDMGCMFFYCYGLKSLDVSNFNTSNVTNLWYMFYCCTDLKSLDVSNFDTQKVTNMSYMFYNLRLTSLDLSNFTITPSTNTSSLLGSCTVLQKFILPANPTYLASDACTNVGTAENPCSLYNPNEIALSDVTPGAGYIQWKGGYFKVSNGEKEAYAVLSADGKKLTFYYDGCREGRSGTTYNLNTGSDLPEWYDERANVTAVVFDPLFADARPTSCYSWFVMSNLTSITGIEYLNTYSVTNMQYMFLGCPLENIDVSHFDTRNVTTMYGMFQNCPNLKNIDVRNFDTSNVKYMEYMFFGCSSLTSLDLSSFTFNSSTEATKMFLNNTSLKHLILPSTANNLASDACYGVGTAANPCSLYFTDDVTLSGVTSGSGYIQWKSGYFKVSNGETKAYANLSADGKRLTFYYDDCREGRSGTTYNALNYADVPLWYNERESVTKVIFDDSFKDVRPTCCIKWFEGMKNLESIEKIQNLNTSEVTHMNYMFASCWKLTSLDVSRFNTAKVVNMDGMFAYCQNLESLDLSGFNTAKVTSMAAMFAYCEGQKTIDISNFDTSNVTNMEAMFFRCGDLQSLDLSNFTITPSTNTNSLLGDCSVLEKLILPTNPNNLASDACYDVGTTDNPCLLYNPYDVTLSDVTPGAGYIQWKSGYFKVSNGEKEAYAVLSADSKKLTFCNDDCREVRSGTTYDLNTGNSFPGWLGNHATVETVIFNSSFADARPTSCNGWFYGMESLTTIDGMEFLNTVDVTNMSDMFSDCSGLESLDLSQFNTANVTDMSYMFSDCSGLESLDLSQFNTANVTNMKYMFSGCSGLNELYLTNFDTSSVIKFGYMFFELTNLTGLDLSSFTFNTEIKSGHIIDSCDNLHMLILPTTANNLESDSFKRVGTAKNPCILSLPDGVTLNEEDVIVGNGYFKWKGGYFCEREAYATLSDDGKTLTFYYDNMKNSHSLWHELIESDTPSWYTQGGNVQSVVFTPSFADARPTTCARWFCFMSQLTDISGLEFLNTSKVTNMEQMFMSCNSLTEIDLSHFDTSNVTNMGGMFYSCSSLTSLDLSSFTFKEGATSSYSSDFLKGTQLQGLVIPSTAINLASAAFSGVGTADLPCTLIYPDDMNIDKTGYEDNGYFMWKGGYFTDILLGDANGDGTVSVADVMLTVNKVTNKPLSVFYERNADVNGDNKISVADVMGIVKMVLSSGPKSAPHNAWQSMNDAMEMTAKGSELTLHLTGTGTYTASQMTLSLPEGCRLESARMVSSRSNGHSVQTSDLGNGQYRVVVYGASGLPFGNSCSDLVRLNVSGNHHGDISLSDIQVVDYHTNTVLLSDVSGIATGIESLSTDTTDDGDWYTVQGQRVTTPTRGIYIRNGKKEIK